MKTNNPSRTSTQSRRFRAAAALAALPAHAASVAGWFRGLCAERNPSPVSARSATALVALVATLLVAAQCTAPLSISDGPTYNYGAQPLGSIQNKVFTVRNSSAGGVTLGTVSSAALGLSAPFSLTGGTCLSGGTVAAGSTCTLIVAFSPTSPGVVADGIDLSYNWAARRPRAPSAVQGAIRS